MKSNAIEILPDKTLGSRQGSVRELQIPSRNVCLHAIYGTSNMEALIVLLLLLRMAVELDSLGNDEL